MSIIRAKNCVPQTYVSGSRDFQIFTEVLDFVQNGIKYNIDSITDTLDTETIPSEYLQNLKSKLGFFSTYLYEDSTLRKILESFPYIIKHKGSELGIHMCINTFMNILGLREGHKVEIVNRHEEDSENQDDYTIIIGIESTIEDTTILEDMLSYVLPIGYFVKFYFYKDSDNNPEGDTYIDSYHIITPENHSPEGHLDDWEEHTSTLRSGEFIGIENDTYNTVQLSTVYDTIDDEKVNN